jgi:Uma2 family endonuclease
MTTTAVRRRFTVAEFARMAEAGLAGPDERLELIDGEVVEMSPIGQRHAACVDLLSTIAGRQLGEAAIVRVQGPLRLDDETELYPDVALLKPREDYYRRGRPASGSDALLVIEVADTSLAYDLGAKAPRYGRAGVHTLWVVDLQGGVVEVLTEPSVGGFDLRRTVRPGAVLTHPAMPNLSVAAADLLA